VKWCPAPGCLFAAECGATTAVSADPLDIACMCGYSFCWNCNHEAHRPVDCDTVCKCARPPQREREREVLGYGEALERVDVRYVRLLKGTFAKLQPVVHAFHVHPHSATQNLANRNVRVGQRRVRD
jgi:hypothetical protein